MSPTLSLIIPAYNEVQRLPRYLGAIRAYLPEPFADGYEVIVVDDGSADGLREALRDVERDWPQLRMIEHEQNRGKGAAVRTGMLAAQHALCLFADADGATPIEEEARLRGAVERGADVAVGSRLMRSSEVVCRRSRSRALLGRFFAQTTRWLIRLPVRDTQCGFKMFRREVAQRLFASTNECGYLFDIELLMLAQRLGYRIAEVPIHWSDQPGSQLDMTRESWRIARGLWRLRRRQITLGASVPSGDNDS